MELKDVIKYEFSYIFRHNPKIAWLLLGLPLLFTLLFGLVYNQNVVKNIPTVIYDQDQTSTSSTLIRAFADSERYNIIGQVTTQEDMEQQLYDNNALVAVVIPPKFSQDIKLGKSSQVMITINTPNIMFSNSVLGTAQEIVQTFSVGAGQKLMEGLGQLPTQALSSALPIRVALRVINNPTFSYSNFVLAGLGANGLQLAIMIAICSILVREFFNISTWQGTSSSIIILGKLLPYWFCSMISFVTYLFIIIFFFAVPFNGSISSLLLIGSAFTFAVITVGIFYSAIAPNEVYAVQLPMLYIMPAFLFSGYSWPQLAMNDFSRGFSAILPLTYAADTIRDILLAGYSPSLWSNAAILFAFGGILFALSSLIFSFRRKRLLHSGKQEVTL